MISNAGRTVCAVVCAAPDTMPSTMSLCTSIVPKYETSWMVSRACSTRDALVLAQLGVLLGELIAQFAGPRVRAPSHRTGRRRVRPPGLGSGLRHREWSARRHCAAAAGRPPCRMRSSSPSGSTMRLRSGARPLQQLVGEHLRRDHRRDRNRQLRQADRRCRHSASISASAVSILRCDVAVTRPRVAATALAVSKVPSVGRDDRQPQPQPGHQCGDRRVQRAARR